MDLKHRVTRRTALLTGTAGAISGLLLGRPGIDPESALAAPPAPPTNLPIDQAGIQRALGKVGQMQSNGVLQFSLDRQDIHPMVENVEVEGSFFLGAEVFFKRYPTMTMAMVEIPIVGEEVNPAIQRAFAQGLIVTGLHNHRIMMSRQVWWLHLMGMGNGPALATAIRQVLPGQGSKFASGAPSKATTRLNSKAIGTV